MIPAATRSCRLARTGLHALTLLVLGCLPAVAQGMPSPDGPPGGPPGSPPGPMMHGHPGGPGPDGMHGGPLAELAMAEADQVASQAIASLAKAPAADVQRMVRAWGVPTVLRYYDIAPPAFHDAIRPGLVAVVRSAVQQQQISASDADRIVGRLEHEGPPPRPFAQPSPEAAPPATAPQ